MKRAFDFTAALIGLIVTSPLVVAAAVAVKLGSPGPAFYSGPRVGRNGTLFEVHKLRSMRVGAESAGPAVTAGDDPRVTGVGRLLRRSKLDELPQLFNVLKGDMSLVGPRPEHPDYVKQYTPDQRRLLAVRPGITGPSALAFIDEEEMLRGGHSESTYLREVLPEKLALELQYVEHATFGSDLKILLKTVALVLRRPFASS
jgi:lipopolysaccharide/colanic/teichoic acid biosynthesis glycosyltransferase